MQKILASGRLYVARFTRVPVPRQADQGSRRRGVKWMNAHYRAGARPLTSAPASGDILRKNGTDNSEIIATPTNTG